MMTRTANRPVQRLLVGVLALMVTATLVSVPAATAAPKQQSPLTTAWRQGALHVDTPGLVSRSDVVLKGAGWRPQQSMPLGNGQLGAGVWAADGFTAQLNRVDQFPDMKSPGHLVVPGLDQLMRAADYQGRLSLHDGQLVQSGGGMTATTYVHAERDLLVLEVTGADPAVEQTADLRLWDGRAPTTFADGSVAALAETFVDNVSGRRSGAVAAATAVGQDVSATVVDAKTVRLHFRPRSDGSFRVVVGVPFFTGGDVGAAATEALAGATDDDAATLSGPHRAWWQNFWAGVAPMKITSADGTGEYMENLRALQLYQTAASMRGATPSSHGAVVSLFSAFKDHLDWSPSHFWHFNLRMQTAANFGADTEEFNAAYFSLYHDNLEAIRTWTREHMPGTEGICVSEVLRFDGTGSYPGQTQCDRLAAPSYVVRILSTGPEVALNIWKQYRYTNDKAFLDEHYPFMRDVVRFYLSYAREGTDGLLHLENVNALENQWATSDPANDLAAMKVLFPQVADLATERGDVELAQRLRDAIPKIPPFRTVPRNGENVIAWSATDEPSKNAQNVDMETVWPWGLFGDTAGADNDLARATYRNRVYPQQYDWGMDSTWAARLGMAEEVRTMLIQGTQDFQIYPNGFSFYGKGSDPATAQAFYNEWAGVVATGLHEALVQSYDGLLRVPAAWPAAWDVDGALQVEGGHRVSVQVRDGVPNHVGIQAARAETLRVRNPWPGQEVQVVNGGKNGGRAIVAATTSPVIEVPVLAGRSYLVERTALPYKSFAFAPVTGTPATEVKTLGSRTIGVKSSTPPGVPSEPTPCLTTSRADPIVDWNPESGDVITDASTYALDASVTGGAAYVAGPDGPALELDGQRFVQTDPTSIGKMAAATFFSEVRVRGDGTYRRLWDYIPVGGSGAKGFLLDLSPSNEIRFIGANQVLPTGAKLPTDTFVKLAVTVGEGSSLGLSTGPALTVYVDGEVVWATPVVPLEIDGCADLSLRFGADQSGASRLVGDVDDMKIWARALTAEEVKAL